MLQTTPSGKSKLVSSCDLPLTGVRCVTRVITELGVYDILPDGGFQLIERAPGITLSEILLATSGKLTYQEPVPEMKLNP
jgi:3-oxoacid CoA-transferase subunit B